MIAICLKWSIFYTLIFCVSLCSSQKFKAISDVEEIADGTSLQVTFDDLVVEYGNKLNPSQVKNPPTITWQNSAQEYYTLMMIDPDAPSRQNPVAKHWLHWLVGNIPGNDVSQGDTLAEYVGAGPPKGTGFHRYIFLLYKQPSKVVFNETLRKKTSGSGRSKFSLKYFIDKYHLQKPAMSANFYKAEWDPYVPVLHKQLSGNQ